MEIDRDFKLKRLHEFRTSIDKIKKIEDLVSKKKKKLRI